MKNRSASSLISVFFLAILIIGCQKDIQPPKPSTSEVDIEARNRHKDGCQLISDNSEFGSYSYTYNDRGLLDQWYVWFYNGYFQHDYNLRGRLVRSRLYSEGVLLNTIIFHYLFDKIVRESWYNGDTNEKVDEVFYFYNWDGTVRRAQSFMGDYHTVYRYTPENNISQWTFFFEGKPLFGSSYTYLHHHKNPLRAVPGLEYGYIYANGAYSQNKWYSSSETDVSYDDQGNPVVDIDQDPTKTIVEVNDHDYVTRSDFYDKLSQEYVHFVFEYQNCDGDGMKSSPLSLKPANPNIGNMNPLRFMRKGSKKVIEEQVAEFKRQLKLKRQPF